MPRVYNQRKLLGDAGLVAAIFDLAIKDVEKGRSANGCMDPGAFLMDEGALDNLRVLGIRIDYYLRLLNGNIDVEKMQDARIEVLYSAGFSKEWTQDVVFGVRGCESWKRVTRVVDRIEGGHDGD